VVKPRPFRDMARFIFRDQDNDHARALGLWWRWRDP